MNIIAKNMYKLTCEYINNMLWIYTTLQCKAKRRGEERKGKSHMPFKAINIFILMHKHALGLRSVAN